LLVSGSAKSHTSSTFIPFISQVFEDGSTYRGRLKLLGRTIVKAYYGDTLQPNIMEGHNSDQAMIIVRDNVTTILEDSSFLLATEPDENVSFETPSCPEAEGTLILNDRFFFHLARAAPPTFPTRRL
jgi:hypothetical protein